MKHISQKRRVPIVSVFVLALFSATVVNIFTIETYIRSLHIKESTIAAKIPFTKKKTTNPVDLHLKQYSDKVITANAIDSNPQFSKLALADFMKKDTPSIPLFTPSSLVAGVGLAQLQTTPEKEYGTWVWTPLLDMKSDYIDSILKGAKTNGITTIYISIDSYLDIYVMLDGPEKEKKKKEFTTKLERFVEQAHKADIEVDAEAGWRNWAEIGNTYKAFAVLNFAKEFNATQTYKLRGFQYDVEPYLLATYKQDPVPVLKNYLTLIDESLTLLGPKNSKDDLAFSIVIPDFYDKDQTIIPDFTYNDQTQDTYRHILDILEKRPNSSVIVMSYRNFSEGTDGTIDISTTEVETATNGLYSTHVIIAQETGDVMPPYITFNNTSKKYYLNERQKLISAFKPYENFGGTAVHYVNTYLELK